LEDIRQVDAAVRISYDRILDVAALVDVAALACGQHMPITGGF
jgi:hypothetical protein